MTITQIIYIENIENHLKNDLVFNTTDRNILCLKDYLETFVFYCKNPYSTYKMFKLLPSEVQLFKKLLVYSYKSYESKGRTDLYNFLNNMSDKIINRSYEVLTLIENNKL